VSDECRADHEESIVDVSPALPADAEATEVVQPSHGALNYPARRAQTAAMGCAALGQQGHAALAEEGPRSTVSEEERGPRPVWLASESFHIWAAAVKARSDMRHRLGPASVAGLVHCRQHQSHVTNADWPAGGTLARRSHNSVPVRIVR